VGGRSYGESQFNRVTAARRQPGSVFKPFVYLAAFEEAAAEGRTDITPATIVDDTPTTFYYEDKEWTPRNYGDEYDGPIPLRRALAMSRNVAPSSWRKWSASRRSRGSGAMWGPACRPRPSIDRAGGLRGDALGSRAGLYPVRQRRPDAATQDDSADVQRWTAGATGAAAGAARVARPDTTFLVTNMMRSVIDEGTGAAHGGRLYADGRRQVRYDQ